MLAKYTIDFYERKNNLAKKALRAIKSVFSPSSHQRQNAMLNANLFVNYVKLIKIEIIESRIPTEHRKSEHRSYEDLAAELAAFIGRFPQLSSLDLYTCDKIPWNTQISSIVSNLRVLVIRKDPWLYPPEKFFACLADVFCSETATCRIEELDLSACHIDHKDTSFSKVFDAIVESQQLKKLMLYFVTEHCYGSQVAKGSLRDALVRLLNAPNCKLQTLSLPLASWVMCERGRDFFNALAKNDSICELELTNLFDAQLQDVAAALVKRKKKLNLFHVHGIVKDSFQTFSILDLCELVQAVLESNQTLRSLVLEFAPEPELLAVIEAMPNLKHKDFPRK